MLLDEKPVIRQKLGIFGDSISQLVVQTVQDQHKYLALSTSSPKDLRYRVNSVQLHLAETKDLKRFLITEIEKANGLIKTIPANRLEEDEVFIKSLLIRYMIRRNKVDTWFQIVVRTGIGVTLQPSEVRELDSILERVVATW